MKKISILAVLLLVLAASVWGATPYTSARNGLWDASDVDTWGQGIGVYPNTAGDVTNIGHTVTYNKSSTTEMGPITLNSGGILTFSTNMSTKLTLGHQDITVNNGGELRVGATGAIIPKTYTAEFIWNTTSDNAKGINLATGGKLTVYGDPDYFGSDYDAVLADQSPAIPAAGNAVTITVVGDFTTKWQVGQELIVHKGGSYGTTGYINDFCRLAITSVVANGANTDIATTVTERPAAALTCLVGADVLNVSRNVRFYKLGYNANLGQNNTLRPRIANANTGATVYININDASFGGFYQILTGTSCQALRCVGRNGCYPLFGLYYSNIDIIIFGYYAACSGVYNSTISGKIFDNGSYNGLAFIYGCTVYADIFGNAGSGVSSSYNSVITGSVYSNATGYLGYYNTKITGNIGYDAAGIAKDNTACFGFGGKNTAQAINILITNPPTFTAARNDIRYSGRIGFEHYQQTANDHYIADCFGDIYKVAADGSGDNPSQRSGGGADVIEAVPQSNCAAASYLELLNLRLWATAAGGAKTYRFYVQTDYATLPTAELKLYGEYLDQGSGGHLATVSSTQDITTRANQSDWSQYVEVTINPAQDGHINLYLRLMGYESTKKVWIDPKGEVN